MKPTTDYVDPEPRGWLLDAIVNLGMACAVVGTVVGCVTWLMSR